MALNDVRILNAGSGNVIPSIKFLAEAAATQMLAGEPVKAKSAGSKYAIPLADAEPVIGTTTMVIGIAATTSDATASADGSVFVYDASGNPGTVYSAKAKSAAAADTESEINALIGKRVLFDLTSSTYTIDTAAVDGNTNGLIIVGGNPETSEIYFKIRPAASEGAVA